MFNEFLTNRFGEGHFLDLIKSVNQSWDNLFSLEHEKQGTILDIGSNIGSHSIKLAENFANLEILAYETNPVIFPILEPNTLLKL